MDPGIDLRTANQLGARVVAVVLHDVDAEVWLDCGGGREVVSVLPRNVIEGMGLHVGESVLALIAPQDVALAKVVEQ